MRMHRPSILAVFLLVALSSCARIDAPYRTGPLVSVVSHRWETKIVDSNYAAVRPGSVYAIKTYFEQRAGLLRPEFNYIFHDTGLGAAEALYPVYQTGYQESWAQLVPALFSDKARHIDHYSQVETPEGCRVESAYWVRHIDEFPDRYHQEREAGYTLVDIGFDYYTKLRPDARCGRHNAFEPDPSFDPIARIREYAADFESLDDIPPELLGRLEAKVGLLRLVDESFSFSDWPRYAELYRPEKNSLWYYPNGHEPDYGIDRPRPQGEGLDRIDVPASLIVEATPALKERIRLDSLVSDAEFGKLLEFLRGRPRPRFEPAAEPGGDAFSLAQVDTDRHYYTHGTEVIPMTNVEADVSAMDHYALSAIVVRPYEHVETSGRLGGRVVPQLRFVFQLHESEHPRRPLEQLYLHLVFDGVDRHADEALRTVQHRAFLAAWNEALAARKSPSWREALVRFVERHGARPVQELNFSSSLTGIWVFGSMARRSGMEGELEAIRIERAGVDVGYYSTYYDNDLFREEMIDASDDSRSEELAAHLEAIDPHYYRDPRRMDAESITFRRMTCAQCHQMSGRDGVHVSVNDGIDPRITSRTRTTEFTFRELERQLRFGQSYWARRAATSPPLPRASGGEFEAVEAGRLAPVDLEEVRHVGSAL